MVLGLQALVREGLDFFFFNLGAGIQTQVFMLMHQVVVPTELSLFVPPPPVCESSATESSFLALSTDFLGMSS